MKNKNEEILEISHVSNRYRDSGAGFFSRSKMTRVLNDVSLTIHRDEMFGLVGESGCGKSTLGKAVLGMIPFEGQIRVGGMEYTRKNRQEYGENNPELLELISDDYIDHNPEDKTETTDETSRLKDAVMSLPFNEQQVVVMRYYNDMKLEDIASALGCSRSSVKRYLITARERLKKMLRKEGEDV